MKQRKALKLGKLKKLYCDEHYSSPLESNQSETPANANVVLGYYIRINGVSSLLLAAFLALDTKEHRLRFQREPERSTNRLLYPQFGVEQAAGNC